MQNLNSNGKRPTADKIRSALANYRENAETLQDYSEFMQHFDMIFARTIKMYVNALSYDVVPVCVNAIKASDYESPEYEKDKARIDGFGHDWDYFANSEFSCLSEIIAHLSENHWAHNKYFKMALPRFYNEAMALYKKFYNANSPTKR